MTRLLQLGLLISLPLLPACGRAPLAGRDEPVPDYPSHLANVRSSREETLAEARKRVAEAPDDSAMQYYLGSALANLKRHEEALAAFSRTLVLKKDDDLARDRCGEMRMCLGRFDEAIADFDSLGTRSPTFVPRPWLRGKALYFVGRYADAEAQFAACGKLTPVFEDLSARAAVWRCLCLRQQGNTDAGAPLLTLNLEGESVMQRVAALLAGRGSEKEVWKAAEARPTSNVNGLGDRFDAHFFLALIHDADGKNDLADRHLTTAVVRYQLGHTDWDVARAWLLTRRSR